MPADSSRGLGRNIRRRLARRRWHSGRRLATSGPMWLALGVAFAAVAVLGVVGFTRYQQAAGSAVDPFATRVYLAVQLFVLESGSVRGEVPWQLELSRFVAPLVAAYAIVQTLAAVFREQVEALRLQLVRRHVVIAGLGHKGARLAQALLRDGDPVVVIEADSSNADLDTLRAVGGLAVIGDARDAETQRRARVARATHLVALCGDDGTDIEVVATAREQAAAGRRSGTLQCVADLGDPDLCLLLCTEELERYGEAPVRTDFVDTTATAAHALLRAHPPFGEQDGPAPSVLVVGEGRTAEHLLLALARAWATGRATPSTPRLGLTVVGPDAQAISTLADRHPELARVAALDVVDDHRTALAASTPTTVFVCPEDDAAATATALDLRVLLTGRPTEIVVVLQQSSGLGRLLESAPRPAAGPTVHTFVLIEETCQPRILLTGTTEILAQALHGAYLAARSDTGAAGDPALRPWSELPESLRESNRDHAAHVAVKLAAVGRAVGPLIDWGSALVPFPDDEVELMARLEHVRWVAERRRAGWRPGPRDPERRTSPYLVPWEDLSEEIRDHDRMFVRELPHLLVSVGLQAVPVRAAPRRAAGPPADGRRAGETGDRAGSSTPA